MKCFYHPTQDAVGMCPQCGKAACRDCLKDVGGGILCKGCIAQQLQSVEDEREAIRQDRQALIEKARRRNRNARIVFLLFLAFGMCLMLSQVYASVVSTDPRTPSVFSSIVGGTIGALFVGYVAWTFFWGFPAIWSGLRRILSKIGCFLVLNPVTWLLMLMIFVMVVCMFGEMYCIFGGGWYQYSKNQRVARGEA